MNQLVGRRSAPGAFRDGVLTRGTGRRLRLRRQATLRATQEEPTVSEAQRVQQARAAVTRRIKDLGRQGKVRDAIRELAGLSKIGVQPDTQAATALVAACAAAGNMEVAQSVFDELFDGFLQPDEVSFAVLLRGYGAAQPPAWPRIDATLTRMVQQHALVPTAVSYNALLEVCVRTSDLDRGLDILDRMHRDDVEPDSQTEEVVSRRRTLRAHLRKLFQQ